MRATFAGILHDAMVKDPSVYLIVADLGLGLFDKIRKDFPDRYINVGAAEQLAVGVAIGLALQSKRPFFYSISPFAVLRPFELLRTYVAHENLNVQIIGSGVGSDYMHDGISHHSDKIPEILNALEMFCYIPETKDDLIACMNEMLTCREPNCLLLHRSFPTESRR